MHLCARSPYFLWYQHKELFFLKGVESLFCLVLDLDLLRDLERPRLRLKEVDLRNCAANLSMSLRKLSRKTFEEETVATELLEELPLDSTNTSAILANLVRSRTSKMLKIARQEVGSKSRKTVRNMSSLKPVAKPRILVSINDGLPSWGTWPLISWRKRSSEELPKIKINLAFTSSYMSVRMTQ